MKKILFCSIIVINIMACSSNKKRAIIYYKGSVTVDEAAKTILLKDGNGSKEKIVDFNAEEKISIAIKGLDADGLVDVTENGLYIINAKNDTLVGGFVQYGNPKLAQNIVTQELLKHQIDSLQQLVEGKNISATNRNFYLLPKTTVKISNNIDADVVGPYRQMTSIAKVEGKEPEVYRFYSLQEIRETIAKLLKLTIGEKI